MRLPVRRSQLLRTHDDAPDSRLLTKDGIERLKRTLEELEKLQRPQAVKDVSEAVAKGDLSENAEYQEAKMRLSRIDSRIFSLQQRIKGAIPIEDSPTGHVTMGSTVALDANGKRRVYQIVGPQETNPSRGRISHLSPLGSALMNHVVGDNVTVNDRSYQIVEIR